MYSKVIISLVFLCFASQCFAFPSPSEGSGSGDVDVLVVSVTPDRYVNKGPTRPIFGEQHRVFFLSNLRSVDYVFLNDTPDAIHPLSTIGPDIYFKGADYKEHKSEGYVREESFCSIKGIRLIHTAGDRFSSTETLRFLGATYE